MSETDISLRREAAALSTQFGPLEVARRLGLLTTKGVAALIGYTMEHLMRCRHTHGAPFPTLKLGNRYYYTPKEALAVVEWANSHRQTIYPGRFSTDEKDEMRRLWEAGWLQSDIAAKFGIKQPTVSEIIHGRQNGRRRNKRRNLSAMLSKSPDAPE